MSRGSREFRNSRKSPDLDGPIRANRFADSRESPDSRESFQDSRTEPFFCESRFGGGGGGPKTTNRRFEAIRANCSRVMKIVVFFFFLRINSRESSHANRPDSRCESPGHLSPQSVCISQTRLF